MKSKVRRLRGWIPIIFSSLFLCILVPSNSQVELICELPFDESIPFRALPDQRDLALEKKLNNLIAQNAEWNRLARRNKMSIGLVDLSNPEMPRYASINGRHTMYAASLPKIAILLAVLQEVHDGHIALSSNIEEDLGMMIRHSNNMAATRMIDLVGMDKISSVLKDPKYQLYNEKQGGLWVGKRYGRGGKRNPDPLYGISHAANVLQVCRFYYLLAFGKLIDREASTKILDYMVAPALHHKFVNALDLVQPDAMVYRKSGTWRNFHSDSVLVVGPEWRSYILVALIESPSGEKLIRDLLPEIETLLKPDGSVR